ncbi:MAG: hypothetical protein QXJ68_05440 [Methanocellales archaeon]
MNKLVNIIKEIFTTAGYNVKEAEDDFDLSAEKGKSIVLIKYLDKLDKHAIRKFAQARERGSLLLISNANAEAEIKDFALTSGVTIWDRTEFEQQIGKAILADVEGEIPEITLTPSRVTTLHITSQPVKITKHEAMAAGKKDMGMADEAVLRFVPYYKFDYSFDISKRYNREFKGHGSGSFNALNGRIDFTPLTELEEIINLPQNEYIINEPVITKEEATPKILEEICKHHAQDIKSKMAQGESVIIEHRVIKPQPRDIQLSLSMVYIPFWEVKSKKGSFEMNAYNGKVSEVPIDNDAEFV